jgi:hypothetical protein
MGTVVEFAQARRAPHQNPPPPAQAGPGVVVILPVIRIEREEARLPGSLTENSKSPSPRKRRKRATRT